LPEDSGIQNFRAAGWCASAACGTPVVLERRLSAQQNMDENTRGINSMLEAVKNDMISEFTSAEFNKIIDSL
jgi:hypothetical protein